jgi:hypothetical protein
MFLNIASNLSSDVCDVEGCALSWVLFMSLPELDLIFPESIRFTLTSMASIIISSNVVDLHYLNNKSKSLSKESAYLSWANLEGGGLPQ